jgi:hypothetical protein
MGIVQVALVIVRKDFVGLADSFEFGICSLSLILWYLIRMVL